MRNVLVTGATRGLGKELATRLVDDGYKVIGTGRNKTPPTDWPTNPRFVYASLDLAEHHTFHPFILELQKAHGPLYGLVNNAAIGVVGVLATMPETEIGTVLNTNLTGTILLTKYAVRSMLLNEEGRVLNIASIVASNGFKGYSVYAATKAGLLGFSQSLAREIGPARITVNCISPGFMSTDMTSEIDDSHLERIRKRSPLDKLATPQDVANIASLLMSKESDSITGENITVDAGGSL